MSNNLDMIEKRLVFSDCEDKYTCKVRRSEHNYRQVYEYDKKMKREIANSNERRRMQSINTGFENLKQLLPMSIDGEKLSKASILQLTAKYIQSLLSRLSTLEEEIGIYKKSTTSKEKYQRSKSPSSVSQEQTRKRRLNSCTTAPILFDQNNKSDIDYDISGNLESFSLPGSETCLLTCDGTEKAPGSLEHLVAAIEQVEGEKFYVGSTMADKQPQISLTYAQSQDKLMDCSVIDRKCKQISPGNDLPSYQCNTLLNSNHSSENSAVMKPTISPYTEKIILAVSRHPHMFDKELSGHIFDANNSSVHAKYQLIATETNSELHMAKTQESLHRSNAVIQKNKTL